MLALPSTVEHGHTLDGVRALKQPNCYACGKAGPLQWRDHGRFLSACSDECRAILDAAYPCGRGLPRSPPGGLPRSPAWESVSAVDNLRLRICELLHNLEAHHEALIVDPWGDRWLQSANAGTSQPTSDRPEERQHKSTNES